METGLRTPLLDFFRRGEVARDVRLLAAQGAIAPRPMEQLGILMILTGDADREIREVAEATLRLLPEALVAGFIARSDVPLELREFFVGRGIEPAATPLAEIDDPFVDVDEPAAGAAETAVEGNPSTPEDTAAITRRLAGMTIPQKVKAAVKGTREVRALLIRDPNRLVAWSVLSSPRLTEQEVENFTKMTNVSADILRTIGQTRAWVKNYAVVVGLSRNPKTPLALSLTLMHRLTDRDVRMLSIDRNVPDPLRIAARQKVVLGQK